MLLVEALLALEPVPLCFDPSADGAPASASVDLSACEVLLPLAWLLADELALDPFSDESSFVAVLLPA